eukprot:m.785313 g.785313  ORF g.785313 m.785313 type:complete len:672 (-) comp59163_c0_seq2:6005-8020(-)
MGRADALEALTQLLTHARESGAELTTVQHAQQLIASVLTHGTHSSEHVLALLQRTTALKESATSPGIVVALHAYILQSLLDASLTSRLLASYRDEAQVAAMYPTGQQPSAGEFHALVNAVDMLSDCDLTQITQKHQRARAGHFHRLSSHLGRANLVFSATVLFGCIGRDPSAELVKGYLRLTTSDSSWSSFMDAALLKQPISNLQIDWTPARHFRQPSTDEQADVCASSQLGVCGCSARERATFTKTSVFPCSVSMQVDHEVHIGLQVIPDTEHGFGGDVVLITNQAHSAFSLPTTRIIRLASSCFVTVSEILRATEGIIQLPPPFLNSLKDKPHTKELPVEEERLEAPPDEGCMTPARWRAFLNDEGQVTDTDAVKKVVFFKGIEPQMRKQVWPFLVGVFSWTSTDDSRAEQLAAQRAQYRALKEKWQASQREDPTAHIKLIKEIKKDVIRTDSTIITSDQAEHMIDILVTYALFDPVTGYSQGMTDILTPLLLTLEDEALSFWVFGGLMSKYFSLRFDTSELGMRLLLDSTRSLIQFMFPATLDLLVEFDLISMYFAYRYLLLDFRREFSLPEVMRLWETIWSEYRSKHFTVFLVTSIIQVYFVPDLLRNREQRQVQNPLEIFAQYSQHMDLSKILTHARQLMYEFWSRHGSVPDEVRHLALFPTAHLD